MDVNDIVRQLSAQFSDQIATLNQQLAAARTEANVWRQQAAQLEGILDAILREVDEKAGAAEEDVE
jgi:hypothetical protein